ncbi:MAG: protein translocase subunit SecF [Treponema sp.]|jgi:preprotein translocase subunit SecF|nr:protein translocase subunit SecF [Treponema sp.]
MKIIQFSRGFLPAVVVSLILILTGIGGYIYHTQKGEGGFNLGVDFQAGLIQEVQFAPPAFSVTYSGLGNASISLDQNNLYIVISGSAVEGVTYTFSFDTYPTIGALTSALRERGIGVSVMAPESAATSDGAGKRLLIQSASGNPQLGQDPYVLHYLPPDAAPVSIDSVRSGLSPLGTVAVQVLGNPEERRFMIRMQDNELDGSGISAEQIIAALENSFGKNSVAVTRADYVGSRFSKSLTDQVGLLMGFTLLLILCYASIRFKPQFAIGAVLAIAHDALIMATFIIWTRMEFNTTTIAAILTILGYSINDTIVIFDRIRETRQIYREETFVRILNRSLSETLSRTIITTITTMLAVLSLFIFTTGSMKDFALALLVGMISGVYSTIFIASGFAYFWENHIKNRPRIKAQAVSKVSAS